MRIQHNIAALNSYRNLTNNNSAVAKNLEKLSSGYRINRAGDDAAGLAISEKMRAQITGLDTAQKNASDGISLVQTAEGALTEVHSMLNRMVELATQSANGTYDNDTDRMQLQKEMNQLQEEINRIADSSNFNGIKLLDGSLGTSTSGAMSLGSQAVNMMDGININSPIDGAATPSSMEIQFSKDSMFSVGDQLTFKVEDADGNEQTITASNITGADFSAQMTSLASAVNTALAGKNVTGYTATATENGIKIAAAADNPVPDVKLVADSAAIARNSAVATANVSTPGANATHTDGTKADHQGFTKLLGGDANAVKDLENGDKLTFNFEVNGKDRTITLETGKDFKIGATNDVTTANLVAALNKANFDSDDTTGIKEEILKFKDYFEAKANVQTADGTTAEVGSIHIGAATTADAPAHTATTNVGNLTITYKDTAKGTANVTPEAAGKQSWAAGTDGDNAVQQITTVTLGGKNMAAGDKFVLEGELTDGRTFKVTLEGVAANADATKNQIVLGTNAKATFDAIVTALGSGDTKIQVTNPDNSVEEVAADKLFGTGLEFTVAATGNDDTDAKMTITNVTAGQPDKGVAGKINRAYTDNAAAPEITNAGTVEAGKAASKSENTLTLDGDLVEQGTTLTIDGKTYEFVSSERALTNSNNVAVVVDSLANGKATGAELANALKTALGGDTFTSAANKAYDVTVNGSSVTIASQGEGEGADALDIAIGASKPTTTLILTTEDKTVLGETVPGTKSQVKAGDSVTINGKVYEFTAGKRTQNEDATQVDISGLTTVDQVAAKLAEVVNATDDKIVARTDGEKSIIFTSKFNENAETLEVAYAAPEVKLPVSSKSLRLQIGDTADKYNQLNVSINDCHTKAIGIADISISTQDDALAAIDVIKGAVNYISDVRGTLGATQNRLEHTINNLSVQTENITAAESTVRDVDMAKEMMAYTKNNILVQAAQAMLAQANQVPQGVLQLLQ